MRKSDICIVLQTLNGFHENLSFQVDIFEDKKVHLLELLIGKNTTGIIYKDVHTSGYTIYNSFLSRKLEMSWVKSLYVRVFKICSSECLLKNETELTEQNMSWNNFLKYISKYVLKNICKEALRLEKNILNKDNVLTIWIQLLYIGKKGEQLLKKCIRKVKHNLTTEIIFVFLYNSQKKNKKLSNNVKKKIALVEIPYCLKNEKSS